MRLFRLNDPVWFCGTLLGPDDARANKAVGKVVGERSPMGSYQVKFQGKDLPYLCHEDNLVMAENKPFWMIRDEEIQKMFNGFVKSDFYKQLTAEQIRELMVWETWFLDEDKTMKDVETYLNEKLNKMLEQNNQTEVVENPQINKSYVPVALDLETDAQATMPAIIFDKQRYIQAIDNMPLEEITAKFIKSIKDAAIAIDKKLSGPIKAWRVEVDEIIAHAESRIAKLKEEASIAEAARKDQKRTEVMELMADMLNGVDLPPEYLSKIVFKDEYLQVTFKGKKLTEDIQLQIDTQVQLYQAHLDKLELNQQRIKNRELLIANLNQQYGFNATYSQLNIEQYPDDERVEQIYRDKKAKQDAEKAKEDAAAETKPVVQSVQENATCSGDNVRSVTVTNSDITGEKMDQPSNSGLSQATNSNAQPVEGLTKQFNITISTGNSKADEAAMNRLSGFIAEKLEDIKAQFAKSYKLTMNYTVE